MSYIENQLGANENVVFCTSIHPAVLVTPIVSIILGFVVEGIVSGGQGGFNEFIGWIWAFPFLFYGFLGFLARLVLYASSEFAVTNRRVIIKYGFLGRSTDEILLRKVEGLRVRQGVMGRIFNYGTVVVDGTGTSHARYIGVAKPFEMRKAANEEIEKLDS